MRPNPNVFDELWPIEVITISIIRQISYSDGMYNLCLSSFLLHKRGFDEYDCSQPVALADLFIA